MRTLLKLLVLALVFWLYAVVAANASELEDTIQSSAVHLFTADSECSGTVIAPSFILTAKHCVRGPFTQVEIGGPDRVCKGFGKVTKSPTSDLALVHLANCGALPVAQVSQNALVRGEAFTFIGLSYDVPWAVMRGYVMAAPVDVETEHKVHYTETPLFCQGCDEGGSGLGVFSLRGELEGVFVATSQNNVRAYMVPLADVKAFLAANKV